MKIDIIKHIQYIYTDNLSKHLTLGDNEPSTSLLLHTYFTLSNLN